MIDPNYEFRNYKSHYSSSIIKNSYFNTIAKINRNKSIAKQLRYKDPYHIEKEYSDELSNLIRKINQELIDAVFRGGGHLDTSQEKDRYMMRLAKYTLPDIDTIFGSKIRRIAKKVDDYNSKNFLKQMQKIAITITDPPNISSIDSFVKFNTDKIVTLIEEQIEIVRKIIMDNPTQTAEKMKRQIQIQTDATAAQAERIAVDQILSLNKKMDFDRQKSMGFNNFLWNTVGDQRVRDSHRELDGHIFSYDDLPIVDGERSYPGMPIRCRCYITPVI